MLHVLLWVALALFIWQLPFLERMLWAVMLLVWAAGVSTLTWEQNKPTWLLLALATTEWARTHWRREESAAP